MHSMQHSNEKDFLNPKLQSGADLLTNFLCSKWSIKGFNQKHSRTIPRSRDGKNHLGHNKYNRKQSDNSRNGSYNKRLTIDHGKYPWMF
ncbi:hypothetical protein DK880_00735 [Candidatus Cardinium hertigii]|uniref:Uncharacterized protein n=1 Tax=Candidatus Cardinium hertigii TaxID=247481 RepID=A0A2Z3LHQ9_9BACT|nr:hypothetical protein DK880_00735 [Candidatus Cardinium hertigii]